MTTPPITTSYANTQPPIDVGQPASAPFTMSPDVIIAYLTEKLSGIDASIGAALDDQQGRVDTIGVINDFTATLQQYENKLSSSDHGTNIDAAKELQQKLSDILARLPSGTTLYANLSTVWGKISSALAQGGDSFSMDSTAVDGLVSQVKGYADTENSNTSIALTQIQSLMQQRTQWIQMATNLIATMGDQEKAIATNVGRT